MATCNHTLQVVSSDEPPPPSVLEQFDKSLYALSCAIAVVKTIEAAIEGDSSFDWGVRLQAMAIAVESLDTAFNRLDGNILRLAREGSRPREAQS